MKMIEKGLAEVHRELLGSNGEGPSMNAAASSNGHANGASAGDTAPRPAAEDEKAFAVVGLVTEGSPADLAVSNITDYFVILFFYQHFSCN